jgi:superfamily II DNA or RNA helicase
MERVTFAYYDNYISVDSRRIRLVKSLIHQCLKDGRTVLVLAKRKNILHQLDKIFEGTKKALIISETNKMKPEEREFVQNEANLILGIQQLANEGLDIPRIDTVIFYHPVTDTEQPIGRAGRVLPDKKQSLVFYLRDNCWVYSNMFRKSINFMKINAELQADITYEELSEVLCQNK